MDCAEAHQLRHLYLDHEIDQADVPVIEAHLKSCAECRALFRADRELSEAIKRDVPRQVAPAALRARISAELGRQTERWRLGDVLAPSGGWNVLAFAASLLLAVVTGSAVTTSYLRSTEGDETAREVVASHIRSLMADHLTDVASSNQHTVRPWFNGKLDIAPPVVDLAAAGYPLVGGRLDYIGKHPAAALIYRRQQHVINVLVWPDAKGGQTSTPAALVQQGYNVLHFARDGLVFWVVSDLNATELHDFVAKLIEATPDRDS